MTNSIIAIVLAGGQSSRMGRDKALIPIQGVPLLQHVCNVATVCATQVYVVTPWPERYQDILPSNCFFVREMPSLSEGKPHGPLLGFAQGLSSILRKKAEGDREIGTIPYSSLSTQWVLLLACDLPRLQGTVLQNWAGQLANMPENAIALLPRSTKGWEPLCGFYRLRCLPALTEFIQGGGRSFQQWLAQHTVQELPLTEQEMLFNCNTPADLAALD